MSLAIISNDKVVFALAFGIPVVIVALMVVWSRPRKWQALWALVSLAAIAGTAIVAVAAFRAATPGSTPAAIPTSAPSAAPPITVPPSTSPPSTAPPTPSAAAGCSPTGTKLHLTASGVTFDTDCLAAPASKAFTIVFENKDIGIPHDVHIFSANPAQDSNAQSLFTGDLVTGPDTATYKVSALPSGTYFFHCDVHPTLMFGTFVSG